MKKNFIVATTAGALMLAGSVFIACSATTTAPPRTQGPTPARSPRTATPPGIRARPATRVPPTRSTPARLTRAPRSTPARQTRARRWSTPGTDTGTTTVDSGTDTGTTTVDSGSDGGDAGGFPQLPALGTNQIDRMGRAAINTALNHAFDPTAAAGTAKNAYNQDQNISGWVTSYTPQFAGNLAVLDALHTGELSDGGGGCGDQPFFDPLADAAAPGYVGLASLLANDTLYLDTSATTCTTYLAVELEAAGVIPLSTHDCGGRKPASVIAGTTIYDVISTTYSVATGLPNDGLTAPTKTSSSTFPYFPAAPGRSRVAPWWPSSARAQWRASRAAPGRRLPTRGRLLLFPRPPPPLKHRPLPRRPRSRVASPGRGRPTPRLRSTTSASRSTRRGASWPRRRGILAPPGRS